MRLQPETDSLENASVRNAFGCTNYCGLNTPGLVFFLSMTRHQEVAGTGVGLAVGVTVTLECRHSDARVISAISLAFYSWLQDSCYGACSHLYISQKRKDRKKKSDCREGLQQLSYSLYITKIFPSSPQSQTP